MNKSVKLLGIVIVVFLIAFAMFGKLSMSGNNKDNTYEESNNYEASEKKHLPDPENYDIALYVTDFKYDNGYKYTEVKVSDDLRMAIVDTISKIDINSTGEETTYGKYKLRYGTEIIYFDPDNNSALYNNKSIYFSKEEKQKIVSNEDHCSCCLTSNCNINLCGC